jgi:hypothetical protein
MVFIAAAKIDFKILCNIGVKSPNPKRDYLNKYEWSKKRQLLTAGVYGLQGLLV